MGEVVEAQPLWTCRPVGEAEGDECAIERAAKLLHVRRQNHIGDGIRPVERTGAQGRRHELLRRLNDDRAIDFSAMERIVRRR